MLSNCTWSPLMRCIWGHLPNCVEAFWRAGIFYINPRLDWQPSCDLCNNTESVCDTVTGIMTIFYLIRSLTPAHMWPRDPQHSGAEYSVISRRAPPILHLAMLPCGRPAWEATLRAWEGWARENIIPVAYYGPGPGENIGGIRGNAPEPVTRQSAASPWLFPRWPPSWRPHGRQDQTLVIPCCDTILY